MKKRNEVKLKDILNAFRRDHKYEQHLSEIEIREVWAKEMGATISKYTSKIYFRQGILYVKLDSSVLRHELYSNREMILQRLNNALGKSVVKEISLQ